MKGHPKRDELEKAGEMKQQMSSDYATTKHANVAYGLF